MALRNRVDEIKQAEVEKTLGRLTHLSPADRELVEGMASSIVNKLIHGTMVTLKSEVASSSGAAFVEAARRFFNLDGMPQSSDRAEAAPDRSDGHAQESGREEPSPPAAVRERKG